MATLVLAEVHGTKLNEATAKAVTAAAEIGQPVHILVVGENVKGAARTILTQNLLGESCGQVCPVEVLCAGACVYNEWGREPIAIGRLQHHAGVLTDEPG